MRTLLFLSISLLCITSVISQKTITYPSTDGLSVTADYYEKTDAKTIVLLFHQAGWSRGEYKEIAPKLNAMGYSCLAVDLRSGGSVNNVINATNKAAKAKGENTEFTDAFQDIEASVAYVKKTYKPEKIILWGSSYSSALVLKYGGDYPNSVAALLSFAPGEYFDSKDYVAKSAKHINIPVFITSAKNEYNNWKGIYDVIPSDKKVQYRPETKGNHGSRALWEQFNDSEGYWKAVNAFLKTI